PPRRAHIRRRSIMSIDAADAIEELVANRLAGYRGASGKNFLDCTGVSSGGGFCRQANRAAAPRAGARQGVPGPCCRPPCREGGREPGGGSVWRANNWRIEIRGDEERVFHAGCFLYQSRMRAPPHAATPGLLNPSSKARRK